MAVVHFSFVDSYLVCGTALALYCLAINGPDEKFQNDLLISFLSMKIGNIEKLSGGKSLLEILLDVLGCIEYSGRYLPSR